MLATVFDVSCSADLPFFGYMGVTCALTFSCLGAAYGTAKSAVGIASMGVMNPDPVMKNIIPVVMAGILGIYGLIVGVILCQQIKTDGSYSANQAYAHLAAGMSCGLACLSAGLAIGVVGDSGVRANGNQPKLYVPMILILIFAEVMGLYGLIIALILTQVGSTGCVNH
eukprot:EW706241.1.p1 GENE.EW706241.1~~EW706241.1.p1  ORF type:complete len:169 (+),score=41.90 EW706241.1:53-559(+)